jgi:hypothetical protein
MYGLSVSTYEFILDLHFDIIINPTFFLSINIVTVSEEHYKTKVWKPTELLHSKRMHDMGMLVA